MQRALNDDVVSQQEAVKGQLHKIIRGLKKDDDTPPAAGLKAPQAPQAPQAPSPVSPGRPSQPPPPPPVAPSMVKTQATPAPMYSSPRPYVPPQQGPRGPPKQARQSGVIVIEGCQGDVRSTPLMSGLRSEEGDPAPKLEIDPSKPRHAGERHILKEMEEQRKRNEAFAQDKTGSPKTATDAKETLVKKIRKHIEKDHSSHHWNPSHPNAPKQSANTSSHDARVHAGRHQGSMAHQQVYKEEKIVPLEDAVSNLQLDVKTRMTLQQMNSTMQDYFSQGKMPPAFKQKLAQKESSGQSTEDFLKNYQDLKDFFPLVDPSALQELCQKMPDVKFMLDKEVAPKTVVGHERKAKPTVIKGVRVTTTITTPQKWAPKVRPMRDETDSPNRIPETESPIDREIRLAREREDEVRRQKGLPVKMEDGGSVPAKVKGNVRPDAFSTPKTGGRTSGVVGTDLGKKMMMKDIQKQQSTEDYLQKMGRIKTTSEMTKDETYKEVHG